MPCLSAIFEAPKYFQVITAVLQIVVCQIAVQSDENTEDERNSIGAPRWLSGLKPQPSAWVMVSGSWDQIPHRALCSVGSLLPPLFLPASLTTCDLYQINK